MSIEAIQSFPVRSQAFAYKLFSSTSIAESGDNIVSTSYLYGGTYNQFKVFFKKFGIEFKIVDGDSPEALAAAIDDRTKAVYIESIGNPQYNVPDIPAIAAAAHAKKVPLIGTFGCSRARVLLQVLQSQVTDITLLILNS